MSTTDKQTPKDALSSIPEAPPDDPIYRRGYVIGQRTYRPTGPRPAPGAGKSRGGRDE